MYKKMKDINTFDKVLGSDDYTEVADAYETELPKSMYELTLPTGEKIRASGNHLWYAETDIDRMSKASYLSNAMRYFTKKHYKEKISFEDVYKKLYLEEDRLLSAEQLINVLSSELEDRSFIARVLESMGHTSEANDDLLHLDRPAPALYLYSCNDLLNYLMQMKKAVLDKDGYFYFGRVYTTEILSTLSGDINIPTADEIKENNT